MVSPTEQQAKKSPN